MRLTLFEANAFNQQQTPADGLLMFFDATYINSVDATDATKLTNLDENMSVLIGTTKLSISNFQYPQYSTVYLLAIDQYRYSNYTMVAQLDNYSGLTPYIHDVFMQTYTEINPTVNYNFTVDASNSATSANNRFEIVYSNPNLSTDNFTTEAIALYPNPSTTNDFNLQLPAGMGDCMVTVYNSLGQLVAVETTEIGENTINCKVASTISTGIFQVVITKKEGSRIVKKWIKE